MTDFLGLSIGMTNLVAARVGAAPVTRRAVLTLYPNKAPEVGVPAENPNLTEPGVVLSGFVERVGDPVPLVASDGSTHAADRLLVEALDAMAHTVDDGTPPSQVAIAVPAHWGPAVLGALRAALRTKPNLSPNGVPPALASDAVTALAALNVSPGLPDSGIVALLDFGGSGTSITLADAANEFRPVDETVRYTEFSGAQVDQALLTHVLADIYQSSSADTASTAAVGALSRLREQCRHTKERLSAETATELTAELPGYHSDIRVTRAELENLISGPLAGVIGALEETLQRNRIPAASLSAVATVGGGAAIPLITQRLSEHFRAPVVTTPAPALNSAAGAALLAARGPGADVPTGLAPAAGDEPATGMATSAWAAGAAAAAATESAADGPASATFRALAWSDEPGSSEPVPYTGADYAFDPGATSARPQMEFQPPEEPPARATDAEAALPWYRRPPILFAAALAAVLVLTGGLAWTLTSESSPMRSTRTHTATVPATTNPETPGAPLTETVTYTGTDGSPTVVTPPTTTTESTSTSASTTASTTTTTATTTTQATTTTTQPTTTTTTRPPTTTTTTQAPPTTTQAPPTTTQAAPPTTSAAFTTPKPVTTVPVTTVPVTTVPPVVTSPQPAAASAG